MQRPNSRPRVRNAIGWRQRIAHLQGSPVNLDLRRYDEPLAEINRLGTPLEPLSDGEMERRAVGRRAHIFGEEKCGAEIVGDAMNPVGVGRIVRRKTRQKLGHG